MKFRFLNSIVMFIYCTTSQFRILKQLIVNQLSLFVIITHMMRSIFVWASSFSPNPLCSEWHVVTTSCEKKNRKRIWKTYDVFDTVSESRSHMFQVVLRSMVYASMLHVVVSSTNTFDVNGNRRTGNILTWIIFVRPPQYTIHDVLQLSSSSIGNVLFVRHAHDHCTLYIVQVHQLLSWMDYSTSTATTTTTTLSCCKKNQ